MRKMDHTAFFKKSLIGACSLIAMAVALPAYADNPEVSAINYNLTDETAPAPDIYMKTLEVDVTLAGGYAQTQIMASFVTDESGRIEGDFILDMPEGAIITGYGLDVNGVLIDGVLIEKAEAKKAFEDRIREGVDPGLAEATRTNAFKTRVFPFQAGVPRTISLTFVSPISTASAYALPLETDKALETFKLSVTNLDGPERPDVALPGNGQLQWESGQTATGALALEQATLEGDLTIAPQTMPVSSIETGPTGQRFLSVAVPVNSGANALRDPKRISIFWDTSLSHEKTAAAEQDFLNRVLQVYPDAAYTLTTFDTEADRLGEIDASKLAGAISGLTYNSATNLGAVYEAGKKSDNADICLIFTDGRATLGDNKASQLSCATYFVSAAEDANTSALSYLGNRGGGAFLNLTADTIEASLGTLARETPYLESLRIDRETLPDELVWSYDGDFLRVIAPIADRARRAQVKIDGQVTRINLSDSPRTQSGIISANWAHRRLTALRAEQAERETLVDMAKTYSIASDETSFLVLERVRDYVENDVPLPTTGFSKEARAEYAALREEKRENDADAKANRRQSVLDEWNAVTGWYDQMFKAEKDKKADSTDQARDNIEPSQRPAPPPPPPPAAQSAREVEFDDASLDEVVVTGSRRSEFESISPAQVISGEVSRNLGIVDENDVPEATREDAAKTITIKPWTPDRPYLSAVEGLTVDKFLAGYYTQREVFGSVPSFYLEMSDSAARAKGDAGLARTIARDIALSALELETANNNTFTAVAERLMSLEYFDDAIWLYTELTKRESFRPQPWRNLALALATKADAFDGSRRAKRALYRQALTHLDHVIETPWGSWAQGIEVISIMEANNILKRFETIGGKTDLIYEDFRDLLDVDLRVTVSWNIDAADMDLHVLEPTGETAFYSNRLTRIGGRMSNDMTNGYGPEEYLIRRAIPGAYKIKMDYFSSDAANPNGAIVIRANIYRNWGRENEVVKTVDLEFTKDTNEQYLIATVDIE